MAEPSNTPTPDTPLSSATTTIAAKSSTETIPKSPISTNSPSSTIPGLSLPATDAESARRTAEARTAFLASLSSVGTSLDRTLQTRAQDISSNSSALARQQAQLEKDTAALAKETATYQKLADEVRDGMKEVGDLQNFGEMMERELMVLEETLRIVEAGEDVGTDGEGQRDDVGEGEQEGKETGKKKWWF